VRLRLGKLERDNLERMVFRRLGARRMEVLVAPRFGEDAAVIKPPMKPIVMAADPITGSEERVGWLAVHVNANDVAVAGGEPRWFSSIILLPEDAEPETLNLITGEIHRAARGLRVSVVTGHTEVTPGLSHPIVAGFMAGPLISSKPITSSGARAGDVLVMWGGAGVEGTAILADSFAERLRNLSENVLRRARNYYRRISVVKPAMALARAGIASAMHDPTEGGVLGGAYEMAEASRVSFILYEEKVPVTRETRLICRALGCDPLKLIASGALLAAVSRRNVGRARRMGFREVGEFRERRKGNVLVRGDGSEERVGEAVQDELWRLLGERII